MDTAKHSLRGVIDVCANTRAQLSHPTLPAFKITYCLHSFVTHQQGLNGHWRSFAWFVFDLDPRIFSPSHLASLAGSKVNSTKALVANSGDPSVYSIYTLKQTNKSQLVSNKKLQEIHYLTANKAPYLERSLRQIDLKYFPEACFLQKSH